MLKVARKYLVIICAGTLLAACGAGEEDPVVIDNNAAVENNTEDNNTSENNFTENNSTENNSSENNSAENNNVDPQDPEDNNNVVTINNVEGPDDSERRCGDAIINEWPLHDAVASGTVTTTQDNGIMQAVIDASEGGAMGSSQYPFVYLNLETGEKVESTDIEALDSQDWHIAFRRIVVRVNSGDSGVGETTLSKISDTTFDDVTSMPEELEFFEDISLDAQCGAWTDPIGNLYTAINELNYNNASGSQSWYNYGAGITPVPGDIYLIQDDVSQTSYKFEFMAWNDGELTVRWAPLN